MKYIFQFSFLALVLSIGLSQTSQAVCSSIGTTDDGGNIVTCPAPLQTIGLNVSPDPNDLTNNSDELIIPVNGGFDVFSVAVFSGDGADVINTSGTVLSEANSGFITWDGGDTVIVHGGMMSTDGTCINTGDDNDYVKIVDGSIISTRTLGIDTQNDDDLLEIMAGEVSGAIATIRMGAGEDILRIYDGTFHGGSSISDIIMNSGDDMVLLAGGTYNEITLSMGGDVNDMVVFATDIELDLVRCSFTPEDDPAGTLVFSMDVAQESVAEVIDEINNADPTGDSIVINGITYTWENCANLIANLNAVVSTITLTPISSIDPVPSAHTVTATVESDDVPDVLEVRAAAPGVLVNFEVISGPNAGDVSDPGTGECNPDSCETDVNGEVTWTYLGEVGGVDTIIASFDDPVLGVMSSNTVEQIWRSSENVPTLSEWGLFVMAGILGITAIIVIRRRSLA